MAINRKTGEYVTVSTVGEMCRAFVPQPLPPVPALELTMADYALLEEASQALGRLDGISLMMPDPDVLMYMYIRKEAVLSSQIEGTQSSLSDLLLYEHQQVPGVPLADVEEVSRYVAAMNYGLQRLAEGFPLSLRLLREIHGVLLSQGRGSDKIPGTFRTLQNWIGGTRPGTAAFVPPPPERVVECLGALEKFLNDDPIATPALLKSAMAHVQFESIHPFLDGNGRLGRLLITLILCTEKVLQKPLLYLSLYFKQHRQEYYEQLDAVRVAGDWEGWVRFFLIGVRQTCRQAVETARAVLELFERDTERIHNLGRSAGSILQVFQSFKQRPMLSATAAAGILGLSEPTIRTAMTQLGKLNILREVTGKERRRIFVYDGYIKLLNEEVVL